MRAPRPRHRKSRWSCTRRPGACAGDGGATGGTASLRPTGLEFAAGLGQAVGLALVRFSSTTPGRRLGDLVGQRQGGGFHLRGRTAELPGRSPSKHTPSARTAKSAATRSLSPGPEAGAASAATTGTGQLSNALPSPLPSAPPQPRPRDHHRPNRSSAATAPSSRQPRSVRRSIGRKAQVTTPSTSGAGSGRRWRGGASGARSRGRAGGATNDPATGRIGQPEGTAFGFSIGTSGAAGASTQ